MKPQSLKDQVHPIARKVQLRIRKGLLDCGAKSYTTDAMMLAFNKWIQKIALIPDDELLEIMTTARDGGRIEIDGYKELASDLLIMNQYRSHAVSENLIDHFDKTQCNNPSILKLWSASPALFPQLHYDRLRDRDIVCGETRRTPIGLATLKEDWKANDDVEKDNWKRQNASYDLKTAAQRKRDGLFKANPDCLNTDELMAKLYGWKPAPPAPPGP